jgi:hypothetical protein
MEASIAKREAFLNIMEMSWHYQNMPVAGFKRHVPPVLPQAEVVSIETAGKKPAGLPTMAEMVRDAIAATGQPCMPRDVTAYIRAKWRGDVSSAVV